MTRSPRRAPQGGAALIVSLIMLVVITIFSLSGARFSALDNRLALNEELNTEAKQMSLALLDGVVSADSNIVVQGDEGFTNCTAGFDGCTAYSIELPDFPWAAEIPEQDLRARVVMTGESDGPPRLGMNAGSSLPRLRASTFEITAQFNRSAEGQGQNEVAQGLILIYGRPQ